MQLIRAGEKADGQLEREPHDAYGLNQEERVGDVGHLVLFNLRTISRRVEHLIVFELWQRFQTEYYDGQQYDEHGYDGHHPSGL